jgi:hypothetical protein
VSFFRVAMRENLRPLIEEARNVVVSDEDLEKQPHSLADRNASIENERVTMGTIERALSSNVGPGDKRGHQETSQPDATSRLLAESKSDGLRKVPHIDLG